MKYETSCGAILYFKCKNEIKYVVVKDRNDNYSFPKGHKKEGETSIETAKREIKEEVGLDVEIDDIFEFDYSYKLDKNTKKTVILFLAEISKDPYINDGEIKEIKYLNYENAIAYITYSQAKEALKEANLYLLSDKNVCCMFKEKDASEADKIAINNLRVVEEYGSGLRVHTCDSGERWLSKCNKCGCYVIVQQQETWYTNHDYYDYIPVLSLLHGRYVNSKYNGEAIEYGYPYKKLFINDGKPVWH